MNQHITSTVEVMCEQWKLCITKGSSRDASASKSHLKEISDRQFTSLVNVIICRYLLLSLRANRDPLDSVDKARQILQVGLLLIVLVNIMTYILHRYCRLGG